ncbi:MAG: hypothetical protein PHQ75_05515, partial [Thermoguttaceae bacterium]|nr:hypothetical protein [Thermoguttaceae bacterium]
VSDGQDKSARKLDISPLPRSSAPGSPQNLPEPQQEPPGATKSFSPSATPDESAAPRIVEEPDAKATLAAIPYAVFNESYDHPLRIYRKNPIREDCDYIADIITLLPRGTYSFGKPGDDVHDIYIQKSTDDWARYKLHETKMIGFSYDAEKFRWDASYTK